MVQRIGVAQMIEMRVDGFNMVTGYQQDQRGGRGFKRLK